MASSSGPHPPRCAALFVPFIISLLSVLSSDQVVDLPFTPLLLVNFIFHFYRKLLIRSIMADGLNENRTARVADLLSDFRTLQYYIAEAPTEPYNMDDYYTEGWAVLRQCALDGQHILECAADTRVPRTRGGPHEQAKAELQQVLLDAYSRRHEAQKIYLRQQAAQRWVGWRDQVLQGQRPHAGHLEHLAACDQQLRLELAGITDDTVYADMYASDYQMCRWTLEDPPLRDVQRWVRARR